MDHHNIQFIARNLTDVKLRISEACSQRSKELQVVTPRLVAVAKTKPKEYVIEAYQVGQRYFGENYVKELYEKSTDPELKEKCPEIKWHFIGHLQSNKINKLLSVPNLEVIETVDTLALASGLNQSLSKSRPSGDRLKIYVQVKTSGEKEKSGCLPGEAPTLVHQISEQCPRLEVVGLMTIGKYDNYDEQVGVNPDFKSLFDCRSQVAQLLQLPEYQLELSMGMSGDYEHAIEVGSTSVRVGQKIFGPRDYSKMPHKKD